MRGKTTPDSEYCGRRLLSQSQRLKRAHREADVSEFRCKGTDADLRQQRWDCRALRPVQNLCWTHCLLCETQGLLSAHWDESRSPHVLLLLFFLFLLLLGPWSLLHPPASSFAQAALPVEKNVRKSINQKHLPCLKSWFFHKSIY